MQAKLNYPFIIETDIIGDYKFFEPYINQLDWVDTNTLYADHEEYQETMYGRKMIHHYIKHISNYDLKLKKFIIALFKKLGINSKDWRADFFLTKAGGSMPMHVDGMSKVALLLPLSNNTGPLICKNSTSEFEITYQTLTILNTQVSHGVKAPTEDRMLFRIALHDIYFEDLGIYKDLI
jgi:hypothetical protein